jgi:hypothetical protein
MGYLGNANPYIISALTILVEPASDDVSGKLLARLINGTQGAPG